MNNQQQTNFDTSGFKKSDSKGVNLLDLVLVLINILAFIAMIFFNVAATIPIEGLFDQTGAQISNTSEVDITPAGWTFSTWGAIYVWQALWLLFNLALLFINGDYSRPLYKRPSVFNRQFHLFICANFLLNISWLFLWDARHFGIAFGVILLMTLTLYAAIAITHRNTYEAQYYLQNRRPCLWGYRILANNGLVFYATWLTIATALNLSIAWTYEWVGPDSKTVRENSSYVALGVIAIVLVVYFAMEIVIFEKFLRYTYSSYIQLAIAFAGILTKQWDSAEPSGPAIFALVLACVAGAMLILKIVLAFVRSSK